MKQERIGILGGTFQPIHNGHLLIAKHAMEQLSLDRVLFIIDRVPPHKEISEGASTEDRLQMLRIALEDEPCFVPETMELTREGKSYTFDTLTELHRRFPAAKLFFLMGSDMLRSFSTWYNPQGISDLATLVCTERNGQSGGEQETADQLKALFGTDVCLLDGVSDLSSTEVRKRVQNALPITGLVPPGVEHYIYYRGLYQPEQIAALYEQLRPMLTDRRMRHTAGVLQTALSLAAREGADPEKTRIAALLHDCAKYLPEQELMQRSSDPVPILPVLHAEAGAQIAKERFGIEDPEILSAIRLHTTGDKNMHLLDKIIYLADMIEPSRAYPGVDEIRAESDLNKAVLLGLNRTLAHVKECGGTAHPATMRAMIDL